MMRNLFLSAALIFIASDITFSQNDLKSEGAQPTKTDTLKSAGASAMRKLMTIDAGKLTYDVEHDIDAKTMTVLEMLRKIPMVTVDAKDKIKVNGSDDFLVYVDGKINRLLTDKPTQMFRTMPAGNIKKISVVLNPGARYDAEGVGGVLEITTIGGLGGKKLEDRAYGTLTAGMTTLGTADTDGSLNIRKGKWTFGGNLNWSHASQNDTHTLIENRYGESLLTSDSKSYFRDNQGSGSLSASFDADSLDLVTASLSLSRDKYRVWTDKFRTEMIIPGEEGYSYSSVERVADRTRYSGVNLDWQHHSRRNPERTLTLSYQYSRNPSRNVSKTEISEVEGDFQDLQRLSDANDNSSEHTIQADFTTPLKAGQSLSAGLKHFSRILSADDSYNGEPSEYDNRNRISSVYCEYDGTFGKIASTAGLRYEYTVQNVEYARSEQNFDTSYGDLVPDASLQWNMAKGRNLSLSYNMRIGRPGISILNPFLNRAGPMSISYGNPELKSEKTNRLTLAWNLTSPELTLSLKAGWRQCSDKIAFYSFYDGNILNKTWGNIVKRDSFGMNIYANWNTSPKTRLYASSDFGYSRYDSARLGQENSSWGGNLVLGFQHTWPWDLQMSALMVSSTRTIEFQSRETGDSSAGVSFTKTFFEDSLSVSLRCSTFLFGRYHTREHSEGPGFVRDFRQDFNTDFIGLSLSYSIGHASFKVNSTSRTISNDDKVGKE